MILLTQFTCHYCGEHNCSIIGTGWTFEKGHLKETEARKVTRAKRKQFHHTTFLHRINLVTFSLLIIVCTPQIHQLWSCVDVNTQVIIRLLNVL